MTDTYHVIVVDRRTGDCYRAATYGTTADELSGDEAAERAHRMAETRTAGAHVAFVVGKP
jgi:hypothetical protein